MPELEIHLKRIQDKLQRLLKQYVALEKENDRLKEDLEKTNNHFSRSQQTVEELKQKIEILKVSSGSWNEEDKKEFEKRINLYLKEIDKCIVLLSE